MVKMDFFISPAYAVLPMMQSRCAKLSAINVFVAVASICGIPLNEGTAITVKHGVPGMLANNADRHPVVRVGASIAVLYENIFSLQKTLDAIVEIAEFIRTERAVVLPPPYLIFCRRLLHDKLVVRRPCRMLARIDDNRSEMRDSCLATKTDFFVERFGGQVPVRHPQVRESMVVESVVALHSGGFTLSRSFDIENIVHNQSLTSLRSPI